MKVLIAIDDSKFSQAAIDTFIAQANPKETEVRFLHVLEPIYTHGQTLGYFPDASRILAEESENAKALLARASQKLGDEGFTVTTALEVGNPKVVIIDSAIPSRNGTPTQAVAYNDGRRPLISECDPNHCAICCCLRQ